MHIRAGCWSTKSLSRDFGFNGVTVYKVLLRGKSLLNLLGLEISFVVDRVFLLALHTLNQLETLVDVRGKKVRRERLA
jgi:hypothetical protein